MKFAYNQTKVLIPIALLFLANLIFFIWPDNIDTLLANKHLMICMMLLSNGIVAVYVVKLKQTAVPKNFTPLDIWIILFSILLIINIQGSYTTLVTDKNLLSYLIGVAIYSVLRSHKKVLADTRKIAFIFLILFLIELGFLIRESFHVLSSSILSEYAFRGSFDNSGKLGIYLAILYPTILYVLFEGMKKPKILKRGYLAVCFVLLLFLILSMSRIGWISAFMSSVIIVSWYIPSKKSKFLFYLSSMLLAIALLWVTLLIKQDSASGRALIWEITFNHLDNYRLSGAGYGRFPAVYNLWQADYFFNHPIIDKNFYIADNTFFAFNEFLQLAVELGWAGGLLLGLLLIYSVFYSFKKNLWAVSVTAFLIICLASYPFREIQHQILFFTLLGLFANQQHADNCSFWSRLKPGKATIPILRLLYLGVISFFLVVVFHCFYQYQSTPIWSEARNEFSFDEKKGIALYRKANLNLQHNAEFLLEYGVRLVEADSICSAKKALEKSKEYFVSQIHLVELGYCHEKQSEYPLAEKYYLQAINISPSKLAPRYQLLLFYDKIGRINDARRVANTIQIIAPKLSSDKRANMLKELSKKYLEKFGYIKN